MRKLDLISKTFNRLTVIEEVQSLEKDSHWLCQCECGNKTVVRGNAIKSGTTKSCGCLAIEVAQKVAKENDINLIAYEAYEAKRVDGVATFLINDKLQKNNSTGYKGVQKYKLADGSIRYEGYLTVNKKRYGKKGFKTAQEAYEYRLTLIDKYVPKGDKNEI